VKISIVKLDRPLLSGDHHDKPLRWTANGPLSEVQNFATRANAARYASIRRQAPSQHVAICLFAQQPEDPVRVAGLAGAALLRSTDRGRQALKDLGKAFFSPGGAAGLDLQGMRAYRNVVAAVTQARFEGIF
jgi:hypothetical protein